MAEILERTVEEISEHGVHGLSVERVARAAEVNKTSVYRRWPTRGELVAAALERVLDDLSLQAPDTGTLAGDLRGLAGSIASFLESPAGRALTQATFAEGDAPALAALAQRRLEGEATGPVAELVGRALARGEWRAQVPPILVFSALVGTLLHRVFMERQRLTAAYLDQLVDLLARGLRP